MTDRQEPAGPDAGATRGPWVRPLRDLAEDDLAVAGGKAVGLARLVAAEAPVPDGFVITTDAYRAVVDPVRDRLNEVAAEGDGAEIRDLIRAADVPDEVASAIRAAVDRLGGLVAVRSSATAEDLAEASFAGQQDTTLGVEGADAVLAAVRDCWASLWTDRAIHYRAQQGVDGDDAALAVVVQRLVPARAAGVLFTADPASGRRDQCLISAAWGLGEAVVSAQVTTDDLVVTGDEVTSRRTADKTVRTVLTPTGTVLEPVPDALRREAVLSDAQVVELARLGRRVAERAGAPQDIEWVLGEDAAFSLVQARPITALPPEPGPVPTDWTVPNRSAMYVRASIVEQLPDPLTPLFADYAADAVPAGMAGMLASFADRADVLRPGDLTFPTINGYAYYAYTAQVLGRFVGLMPLVFRAGFTGRGPGSGIRRWQEDAHPAYLRTAAEANARDVAAMTSAELLAWAMELLEAGCLYYSSVQTVIPSVATAEIEFSAWHRWFVRKPGDPAPETLLLGGDSEPIRAEASLFDLAAWVRERPALAAAVEAGVADPWARPGAVDEADWGEFLRRLRAHLDAFGHAVFDLDFSQPVAADDPSAVLDALRFFVRGEGTDPRVRRDRLRAEADAAADAIRVRLARPLRRVFDRLLDRARDLGPVREDALADVGLAWPAIRRALLEVGRRFVAAGALAEPEQIFWLRRADARRLAVAIDRGEGVTDATGPIAARRTTWRGQALATPPGILPERSVWHLFDRLMPTAVPGDDASELRGTGASGGRVTAPARVVRGAADFASLQPGEVLVASITTPAWTPLFARASAVVTEVGGPLSHSSIVAREYGIPAVLGTGSATDRIRTGDRIVVDGGAGRVTWASGGEDAAGAEAPDARGGRAAGPGGPIGPLPDDETVARGRTRRLGLVAAGCLVAVGVGALVVAAARRRRR